MCVRNKQSFRSRARDADNDVEGSSDYGFLVQRRRVGMHERRRDAFVAILFVELYPCSNRKNQVIIHHDWNGFLLSASE